VTQDNGACTFSYQFVSLPAGVYTLAFSSDATTFRGTAALTLPTTPIHDFPPTRRLQVGPTRTVGPTTFKLPSAAIAAAQAGDVIEIDSGTDYVDDNAFITAKQSYAARRRRGPPAPALHPVDKQRQGIWVNDGQNTTVEISSFPVRPWSTKTARESATRSPVSRCATAISTTTRTVFWAGTGSF